MAIESPGAKVSSVSSALAPVTGSMRIRVVEEFGDDDLAGSQRQIARRQRRGLPARAADRAPEEKQSGNDNNPATHERDLKLRDKDVETN